MFFPQRPGAGFIPILTIMDHHVRRTHSPFISNYHEVEHVVRYQGRASCDGDKFAARGCHIGVNPDGLEQGGEVNACGLRREGVDLVNIAPTTAMSGFVTRAGHRLFAFKDLQPTLPKCGRPVFHEHTTHRSYESGPVEVEGSQWRTAFMTPACQWSRQLNPEKPLEFRAASRPTGYKPNQRGDDSKNSRHRGIYHHCS